MTGQTNSENTTPDSPHLVSAPPPLRTTAEIEEQYLLGLRLMNYKRFKDAREEFEDALRSKASDPIRYTESKLAGRIPFNLAYAQLHLGNTDRAIALFYESIDNSPGNYFAFGALRSIFRERGDRKNCLLLYLRWARNLPALWQEAWKYVKRCERDAELLNQ
jgi:tetratricopeptide (TPR) repeat protein